MYLVLIFLCCFFKYTAPSCESASRDFPVLIHLYYASTWINLSHLCDHNSFHNPSKLDSHVSPWMINDVGFAYQNLPINCYSIYALDTWKSTTYLLRNKLQWTSETVDGEIEAILFMAHGFNAQTIVAPSGHQDACIYRLVFIAGTTIEIN